MLPDFNENSGKEYLIDNDLLPLIEQGGIESEMKPDYIDLARLHYLVRNRKCMTVLEFGTGFSTLILGKAVQENQVDWGQLVAKPRLRNSNPFKVFTVDASQQWIENTDRKIPADLKSNIEFHYSPVQAGTFLDRHCHFYQTLPDIVPDLILLDGPDPANVAGNVAGQAWCQIDRTVMSGDILRIEPTLLPGTMIVIDGRVNNARFLINNLQRNWFYETKIDGSVTILELQEPPLGKINHEYLMYSLGPDFFHRLNYA